MSVAADVRQRGLAFGQGRRYQAMQDAPDQDDVERAFKAAIQTGSIIAFLLRKRASGS